MVSRARSKTDARPSQQKECAMISVFSHRIFGCLTRLALAISLGLAGFGSAMANDKAAQQDAETAYNELYALRELDRRCAHLQYHIRVDLDGQIDSAQRMLPETQVSSENLMNQALASAVDGYQTPLGRRQQAARDRVSGFDCDSSETNALYSEDYSSLYFDCVFLLRNPAMRTLMVEWAESEPMVQNHHNRFGQFVQRRLGEHSQSMISLAGQRVAAYDRNTLAGRTRLHYFPRYQRLITALLAENAAEQAGYKIVYRAGPHGYTLTHPEEQPLTGACLVRNDNLTIRAPSISDPGDRDQGEPPGLVRQPAYGFDGVLADGRIVVLVNSLTTENLPGDLQAFLFVKAGSNADFLGDNGWREEATRFDGEALSPAACAAQACFVFSADAADAMRVAKVNAEIYIGVPAAFPIPARAPFSERSRLRTVLTSAGQ